MNLRKKSRRFKFGVFRNFLASDLYLSYVQSAQQACSVSDLSAKQTPGSGSTGSSVSGERGAGAQGGARRQDDSGHFSVQDHSIDKGVERERERHSDSTSGVSESTASSSQAHNHTQAPPLAPNTSLEVSNLEESVSGGHGGLSQSLSHGVGYSVTGSLPTLHENSELELDRSALVGSTAPTLPDTLISSLTSGKFHLDIFFNN